MYISENLNIHSSFNRAANFSYVQIPAHAAIYTFASL